MRLFSIVLAALLLLTQSAPLPRHSAGHRHAWHPLGVVFVTGYDDTGTTSTGVQAGPGICAVDPAWVPYGSLLKVAGLWTCRAADTGNLGWRHIDMWVPSADVAYAITGYRRAWLWR